MKRLTASRFSNSISNFKFVSFTKFTFTNQNDQIDNKNQNIQNNLKEKKFKIYPKTVDNGTTSLKGGIISRKIQKPVKIVFDLDCVLVSDICCVDDMPSNFHRIVKNVGEDSIVESCGYYFYLYNGWKELIKYVME